MGAEKGVKPDPSVWLPLLDEHRLNSLPHDTVIEGTLKEGLSLDHPDVVETLASWPGRAYLLENDGRVEVVLVYQLKTERRSVPWVPALLFLLTLVSTLGSGAMLAGVDPFDTAFFDIGSLRLPYPTGFDIGALREGIVFALPFMAVLLVHEMGHYVAARWHGVTASLPYFLPFPPYYSVVGTLGAFIRLRGPSVRRSVLFDIGASGPLASFVVSVPLFVYGLGLSRVVPGSASELTPFLILFFDQPVWLGSGLATTTLAMMAGVGPLGDNPVLLHPLALVGWLGLFVTALNLLPLGQLDGGHILYAQQPERQRRFARLFLVSLLAFGFVWRGWWVWAALVLFLHRGGVGHPPLLQPEPRLGGARAGLAWFLIGVFFLLFVPVPIRL